jgi:hypothetical protein
VPDGGAVEKKIKKKNLKARKAGFIPAFFILADSKRPVIFVKVLALLRGQSL